jgi:hypothetical protein
MGKNDVMVSNGNDTKGAIEQALVDAKDKVANAKTDKVDKVAPIVVATPKPQLFQDTIANRILALKGDKSDAEWINSFAQAMRVFSKAQGKLGSIDIGPSIALLCKEWKCDTQQAIASAKALPPIVATSMSKELQQAIGAIVASDDKAQQIVNDVQSAFGDILPPFALNAKPNEDGTYVVTHRKVSVGGGNSPSRDTIDFPKPMKIKKVTMFVGEKINAFDKDHNGINITPPTTITSGTSSGQYCASYLWANKAKDIWGTKRDGLGEPSVADGPCTFTHKGNKYVHWVNDDKKAFYGYYQAHTFLFELA